MAGATENEVQLPENVELAGRVLDARHASKLVEMGWIGRIFGSATEKPGNIAAMVIAFSFAALVAVLFFGPNSADFPKGQAVTAFISIITGALGFVFGRST
jgi:hypothetical protein